ncbi:MAG: hypothetical protein H6744_05320 [Deltaproteobacteria bacterium]|nr:hypothetical protein [Deltaproteobacteria bacterium]MCB9786098.1 hypothetical protein [Deltaproteobacteria bacterium]
MASALWLAACLLAPSALAATDPPDLSGTWGRLDVTTSVSQVPMIGDVTTTYRAISRVQIAQTGTKLTMEEHLCVVRFESDHSEARSSLVEGFVATAPPLERHARLVHKGGKWRLDASELIEIHGARLEHPDKDALPTDPKDPRVRDMDHDGHPGLTVNVAGLVEGSVHLVQRVRTLLRGLVRSADRIDGLITWSRAQSVLEATNLFLRNTPSTVPHPDPSRSWFRAQRVRPGTDCATLVADAERLFAR